MVDRYYRKIEDVENNIENAMQISSILLKLKGYDNDLLKLDDNETNISSNLSKIHDNTNDISSNLEKINDNASKIVDNLSNLTKIKDNIKISNDIYNETFVISNTYTSLKNKVVFSKIINSKFTTNGVIKINAIYNYKYDTKYNFKHLYRFYNNRKEFKVFSLYNNRIGNLVNDKFNISAINSSEIKIVMYLINNDDRKKIELFGKNTIQIIYNETYLKSNINKDNISSNLKKIEDNASNLLKINNITKTFMLKNIYFTDFDSTDEPFVKELLLLDNTPDRSRVGNIHTVNMEYNFKKDDFIEIDCKLLIYHTVYDNAKNNIVIYYDLYDETVNQKKVLFREARRYNQFPLVIKKDRIIVYTKLCYKVKYDVNNIKFLIHINSATTRTHLILYHHIIQKGVNYISIKHYGKV